MNKCRSTHGGVEYALGSYWDGHNIVCGICGAVIINPPPTGCITINYGLKDVLKSPILLFKLGTLKERIRVWPKFLKGERGKRYESK